MCFMITAAYTALMTNVDDAQKMYKASMAMLKDVSVPLALLNDGTLFSETVHELRMSLLDGVLKKPIGFLFLKKLSEAENRVAEARSKVGDDANVEAASIKFADAVRRAKEAAKRTKIKRDSEVAKKAAKAALKTAEAIAKTVEAISEAALSSPEQQVLASASESAAIEEERAVAELERVILDASSEEVCAAAEQKVIETAKNALDAKNALLTAPDTRSESERVKAELIETINSLVRYIAEILEEHQWNEHFLAELGRPRPEAQGEPFVERDEDSSQVSQFQVLQIKKLMNSLYHLEHGLKAIESPELKNILEYLADEKPEEPVSQVPQAYSIGGTLLSAASYLNPYNWAVSAYNTAASTYTASKITFKGYQIVYHIYRACNLLTHIEPEFLSAFGPEWAWIQKHLHSEGLASKIAMFKTLWANQNSSENLKKMAYLQGVLLDQLRPNKMGGADYSLLIQLATGFGEALDHKTEDLQVSFSDSGEAFKTLKKWLSGVLKAETVDKFEALVSEEIRARPEDEKKRLSELNDIAPKLAKAFGRLSGRGMFLSFDIVHYVSIAWYTSKLISDIAQKTAVLSGTSQTVIREIVVGFRDEFLAELVGAVDKAEEALLCAPGSLTGPLIAQLDVYYKMIIEKSTFVNLTQLGPLQSEAFTRKRLEMARARRARYLEEGREVDEILIPALDCLTNANPNDAEKETMARMYQLLQPHIESVDAGLSNELIARWSNVDDQPEYPVIASLSENDADQAAMQKTIQAIRIRLDRIKRTKTLAIQMTDDLIEASLFSVHPTLRDEPVKPVVGSAPSEVREVTCFGDLTPASKRKVEGYLVADNTEGVIKSDNPDEPDRPDPTKDSSIKKVEKVLDSTRANIQKYGIDPEGNHDSSLSLTHVTHTLGELKDSCGIVQNLHDVNSKKDYVSQGIEQVTYVGQTIELFNSWIKAFVAIKPFGEAVHGAYTSGSEKLKRTCEAQTRHYRLPESAALPDLAYSGMHAALTGPVHFKALAKGQSHLSETSKKQAHTEAEAFADEVGVLAEHVSIDEWFIRYPVLAYDAGHMLVQRLMSRETIDQKVVKTINKLSGSAYKTVVEHGLEGLNNHVFHELLCASDDMERVLTLPPGTLSLPLEGAVDDYMKAFLDPLSVPSEKYFKVRVNKESFIERATRQPHGSSHAAFFDKRLKEDELIKKREAVVRAEAIDRVFELELMRTQKTKKFELKHANKLYLNALRKTLRPAMQTLASEDKDTGGFEDRVFDLMYKLPIDDLSVFDESANKGSCRLDAMREYISNLEAYLKPTYAEKHGFLFYLFEDKKTHAKKLKLAQKLRALVDDKSKLPSVRIKTIQSLLNEPEFKKDMSTYSAWFSFTGLLRAVVWLLSCVWLCSFKTAGMTAVDALVRAADMTVSELQVFDELYAKDYRRLDAMLKQVTLLETYLNPKKDKSYVERFKLFENKETQAQKQKWVKKLRHIAEDKEKTGKTISQRIDAMRDVMADPEFKRDMLAYSAMDNGFTFEAFKRGVLWLLSCVGLYTLPCAGEYYGITRAANPNTSYKESPLIDVGLFRKSVPSTERNYTAESACEKLGLASAA